MVIHLKNIKLEDTVSWKVYFYPANAKARPLRLILDNHNIKVSIPDQFKLLLISLMLCQKSPDGVFNSTVYMTRQGLTSWCDHCGGGTFSLRYSNSVIKSRHQVLNLQQRRGS